MLIPVGALAPQKKKSPLDEPAPKAPPASVGALSVPFNGQFMNLTAQTPGPVGPSAPPPQAPAPQPPVPQAAPAAPAPKIRPPVSPGTPVSPFHPPTSAPPAPTATPSPSAPPITTPPRPGIPFPSGPLPNNLRTAVITPGQSSATIAANTRTTQAADRLAANDPAADTNAYADQFQRRLAPSTTPFTSVGTDAGYDSAYRSVNRRAVDPNVEFQGVDQNVNYQSPGSRVTAGQVDTDVSRRQVDPRTGFRAVGTDVGYQSPGASVGFDQLDTNIQMGERIRPEDSDDLLRFRGMRQGAAEDIAGGTDRSAIAQDRLAAFDARESPEVRDKIRSVGQRAAALGRIGMGQTSIEALQPYTDYLSRRAGMEHELAADTAAGEIDDRYRELEAARGLVGEEEEFGSGRRSELRGERSFETAVNESNIGRQIGERDTEMGLDERNLGRSRDDALTGMSLSERNLSRQASERDAGLSADERNIMRDMGLASEEAGLSERNLSRRASERDFGAGLDTENLERERDDARYGSQLDERNVARQTSERDAMTALLERNRTRDLGLAGEEADLDERNLGREMDDRRFQTGLDESNIEREMSEADRRTAFDERGGVRSDDAKRAALEAAMRQSTTDEASMQSRLGMFGDLENDVVGREGSEREEMRGERDFQQMLERMALEDAIRQQGMETGEDDRLWARDLAEDSLEAGINPAGIYQGAAGQYGAAGGAGYSAAGDLLAQWMARQRQQQGG